MRKMLLGTLGAMLVLVMAGQAGAKTIGWHGTMEIDLGTLDKLIFGSQGVATINNSTGGTHLLALEHFGGSIPSATGSGGSTIHHLNSSA